MLKNILLVSNELDYLHNLESAYREANYLVDSANDGVMCLNKARADFLGIILMDAILPKCSGLITCRLLKFDKRYRNIPVIIISQDENDEQTALEVGADYFFGTATDSEQMIAKTDELLAKKL